MKIELIFGIYALVSLLRFVYILGTGFLYQSPKSQNIKYNPLVSVIIPAHNEQVNISKTINSILFSTYERIEIIVVNDGSTDKTREAVTFFTRYFREKVFLINQDNKGKAQALNSGITQANGEIIMTVDADSYLDRNAIELVVRALSDPLYDCAVGRVVVANTSTLLGVLQYFEYAMCFHVKGSQNIHNSIYIFPGAITAIRKEAIERVGLFENYSKTEDLDISMKLRADNRKVVYIENAICYTEGASDIQGLINQRARWRHGLLQCLSKRKDFVFNNQKGFFLTYFEVPSSILIMFDIFLYPLIFLFLMIKLIQMQEFEAIVLFYFLMPYCFFLIIEKYSVKPLNLYKYIPILPILFHLINVIEYVALIKALFRIVTKRQTSWTNWQRVGV